jgi:hypothetical protein
MVQIEIYSHQMKNISLTNKSQMDVQMAKEGIFEDYEA